MVIVKRKRRKMKGRKQGNKRSGWLMMMEMLLRRHKRKSYVL